MFASLGRLDVPWLQHVHDQIVRFGFHLSLEQGSHGSALPCGTHVPGFHGDGTATAGTDHNVGLALVEFLLSDPDGSIKIVVGQGWVQDRVAVVLQIGRLQAARCRLPAVEEEDFHCNLVDVGDGSLPV